MSAPRTFIAAAVTALTLIALGNLLLAYESRDSLPNEILRKVDEAPRIDTLMLGNSMAAAGFDSAAFAAAWPQDQRPSVLNGGLGSSGPLQHLLIGRRALARHGELRTIVYGFFDFMLTAPAAMPLGEILGNHAMVFNTEPDVAARHLFDNGFDRAMFHAARRVPMFAERGTLWARVERWRRGLSSIGMPAKAETRFGRVEDFENLSAASPEEFHRLAARAAAEWRGLTPPVSELISLARARNIRAVFVQMPMRAPYRARSYDAPAWRSYMGRLDAELRAHGAEVIHAADWMPDDQFIDIVHLSDEGARRFSARLAAAVRAGARGSTLDRDGSGSR